MTPLKRILQQTDTSVIFLRGETGIFTNTDDFFFLFWEAKKCLSIFSSAWGFYFAVCGGLSCEKFLYLVLVGCREIVSRTLVVGDIKTNLFFERINTEQTKHVQDKEERNHCSTDPSDDPKYAKDLAGKKACISRALSPFVKPTGVLCGSVGVCSSHASGFGKESNSNNTPGAIGKVNRYCIYSVVNPELDKETGETVVHKSTDETNDQCGPGCNNGAASGDSNKAGKGSVHCHGEVISCLAGLPLLNDSGEEHGSNATSGGSNGGSDSTESSNSSRSRASNSQSGARVESVPSEPKNESSKNLKRDGVGRERFWLRERNSISVVEASDTRSENLGGDESGGPSSHVHHAGASKVDHTHTQRRILVECREEAVSSPDGVHNDGVDESSEEDGVAEVGRHLAPLCYSSCNNSSSRGGEGELEEEANVGSSWVQILGQVNRSANVAEEEVGASNEGLGFGVTAAVSEGESDGPETESTTACIEQVLQHNVLYVLLAHGSGAEHGKSCLHQEHERTCKEKIKDIKTSCYISKISSGFFRN
mmetsp:Transcript_34831/g.51974  ORF Transcript_34831/g.51974 Transcript_34831/m.51974 type:complete len:537 (-) Transcript_34831:202-1812(-)